MLNPAAGQGLSDEKIAKHPTGRGRRDTHALTLSSGNQNRSRNAGKPYRTLTWAEMLRRAETPSQMVKDKAPWVMASTYGEFDARTAEAQRERGSYAMLPGDIDEGNPSQAQLEAALHKVFGPCEWLIHSSSSAKPDNRKWRYWVRLAEPLNPTDFESTQKAVLDLLLAEGIKADSKISDLHRLFYLPNVPTDKRCRQTGEPLFYSWKHNKAPRLELHPEHPIAQRAAEMAAEAAAEAQRVAQVREVARQRKATQKPAQARSGGAVLYADDFESVVESYNTEHDLAGEFLRWGWVQNPGNPDDFHWPGQTTSSFATRIFHDDATQYAISQSGSVADAGMGHRTSSGACRLDAFGLFAHYEHKGDRGAAFREWQNTLHKRLPKFDWDSVLKGLPSAKEARELLSEAVAGFHKVNAGTMALTDFVAPLHILEASLGLGKTTTALAATVERIRQLREQGDAEGAAVVMVPMHRLSEQIKADLRMIAPDLTVEILRGVEAQDPVNPDENVCKQLTEYRKRQRLMIDLPCETCPFAGSCLFLKGKTAKADVYIQAHGALASKPAPSIQWRGQYLDHVVIDESPLSALLFGTNGTSNISTAAWRAARLPAHPDSAADLAAWRGKVEEAAQANGEGPLDAFRLDAVGLTADLCREAAGLEWSRKVELSKDAEDQTKRAQVRQLEQNLSIRVTAGIWAAMAELLEGGKGIGGRLYVRGDVEKGIVIELQGVRAPHAGYAAAPMLALDATADAAVAEAILRREVTRVDVIRAAEPMLRVTQDRTFSGSKALLLDSPTEKGKKACANNRRRLENFIRRKARKLAPQRLLFIGNKDVVELLELPDNVVTAHFNALRGLNDFQDVAEAVIVGRPQPSEGAVNRMASAIFDRHIDERIDWKGFAERQTVHGPVMGKASIHPDADAQRVLTLTRDAEVEQAIGRPRAVNRVEPVHVTLLSDAVVRQTVELAPIWAEQVRKADPLEAMLEYAGIAFLSPAHAAKAYPTRWKSLNAAKYALGDLTSEKRSLVTLYDVFSPVVVSYRLPRAKVDAVAVLDTRKHPHPQAALERIFGPLAHFEVLEEPANAADDAVNEQVKRLEYISKRIGYKPKVTVREVESPVFIAGQVPAGVMADGLRRRGFEVMLE